MAVGGVKDEMVSEPPEDDGGLFIDVANPVIEPLSNLTVPTLLPVFLAVGALAGAGVAYALGWQKNLKRAVACVGAGALAGYVAHTRVD